MGNDGCRVYTISARAIDNNDDPLAFSALFARCVLRGSGKGKIEDFYVTLSLSRVQPTEFVISSDGDEWIEITRC